MVLKKVEDGLEEGLKWSWRTFLGWSWRRLKIVWKKIKDNLEEG